MRLLSLYTLLRSHFVRELLYQEVFSLHLYSISTSVFDVSLNHVHFSFPWRSSFTRIQIGLTSDHNEQP